MAVILASLFLVRVIPVDTDGMLNSVNVVQILGVILAGQLAILALTVPALFDAKAAILDSPYREDAELLGLAGNIAKELKSNTLLTFLMFGIVFFAGAFYEPNASSLSIPLPFGFDMGMVFAALKVACVVLSCLAMWDSAEPLFGLGEVKELLKQNGGE